MPTKKVLIPKIEYLSRLAAKKIFVGLNYFEEKDLEIGIEQQIRKVRLMPIERKILKAIVEALIKNEQGGWTMVKETLKRLKISYTILFPDGIV